MSLYNTLFDWQKQIVDKFFHRDSFGLFLDMGLGKTILSLAFAEQHTCTKVLVISINAKAVETENINGSWLYWGKQSSIKYRLCNKSDVDFDDKPTMLLVNYESLEKKDKETIAMKRRTRNSRRCPPVVLRDSLLKFIDTCENENVALIIDESHKLKNLQSQQTKSCMRIQKLLKAKTKRLYTYLLTGTPFTRGYEDLYSQLQILGYPLTKGQFLDKFCVRANLPGLLGWEQPIIGYKNLDMLYHDIHMYSVTIKSEEVVDLPEQIFVKHILPPSLDFIGLTSEHLPGKVINNICKKHNIEDYASTKAIQNNPFYSNIDYPDYQFLAETSGTFWLRARQLTTGFVGNDDKAIWYDKRRLEQLKEFLEEHEDNYIVFYNYTAELYVLFEIFDSLAYNIDVYCGAIKNEFFYQRYSQQTEEERFNNKKNVIIANFTSGSTGKNWQLYNKCIIFSMPVYKDWQQGIKRIHREGQKSTVFYHLFLQDNWLDRGMKDALDKQVDYDEKLFESDKRLQEMFTD